MPSFNFDYNFCDVGTHGCTLCGKSFRSTFTDVAILDPSERIMGKRKLGGMGTSTVGSQLSALNSSKGLGRDGLIVSGGGLVSNMIKFRKWEWWWRNEHS